MMEKILSDFLEMVQADAISFDERKVADICLRKLEELGCVDICEDKAGEKVGGNTGNIFARYPGTLPGAILFSAHMDRMPKGFGIEPVVENGIISTKGDTILAADDLGGTAAICEMLMRTLGDDLYLLQALPADWQEGRVEHFCGHGGLDVSFAWKNGTLTEVTLTAPTERRITVHSAGKDVVISLLPGQTMTTKL